LRDAREADQSNLEKAKYSTTARTPSYSSSSTEATSLSSSNTKRGPGGRRRALLTKASWGAPIIYTSEMAPTGRSLFILNLYAEASMTTGFRYVKELLMQRHNLYRNNSYKLLTDNGVDVYTSRGTHSL
ncbi:MAG: hypothetical protein ACKO96_34565, partial [Flammeovirgaceae bacterium]